MKVTHPVVQKREEIQVPPALHQVLVLEVILGQTPRQRTRAMRLRQTMNQATKLRAENHRPSE